MRAGHSARSSAETEPFPFGDPVSYLHLYLGKVHVERRELLAMIDNHQVALVEHGLGNDHLSVIRSHHWRSRRRVEVRSRDECWPAFR